MSTKSNIDTRPHIYIGDARYGQSRSYARLIEEIKQRLGGNFPISRVNLRNLTDGLKSFKSGDILIFGLYSSTLDYLGRHIENIKKRPDLKFFFDLEVMENHNLSSPTVFLQLDFFAAYAQKKKLTNFKFISHSKVVSDYILSRTDSRFVRSIEHPIASLMNVNPSFMKSLEGQIGFRRNSYRILLLDSTKFSLQEFQVFVENMKSLSKRIDILWAPHPNFETSSLKEVDPTMLKSLGPNLKFFKLPEGVNTEQVLPLVDLSITNFSTIGYVARDLGYHIVQRFSNISNDSMLKKNSSRYLLSAAHKILKAKSHWISFLESLSTGSKMQISEPIGYRRYYERSKLCKEVF